MPRIKVTGKDSEGRNVIFHDNVTGQDMTRAQFVRAIERGRYTYYHVRKIKGIKRPASNPDNEANNNLG